MWTNAAADAAADAYSTFKGIRRICNAWLVRSNGIAGGIIDYPNENIRDPEGR